MTTRSLFNIILKVLGIFFIKDFLATIPQLLSAISFLTKSDTNTEAFWTLISTILVLFAYAIASYLLVFKSELLIDKLRLEKGFNQEMIPLNIHRSTILRIAIIVIGGLMVANEIPNLCRQLYMYYLQERLTFGLNHPNMSYAVLSAVKILIGILLISYQGQIGNFIEWKRKR